MKFLADECFDARLSDARREEGHDVFLVREVMSGARDATVLTWAYAEERILLTEDTDFGELVYRLKCPAHGVILLRLELAPVAFKLKRLYYVNRPVSPAISS